MVLSSNSGNEVLPIYDIYVLEQGGIPVFAGCTTSDYCNSHADQHPLHTGFIHAIQNFGDEVFSSGIRNVQFETVKLNFKSVGSYSLVFVNPLEASDQLVEEKLEEVCNLFMNKYAEEVQSYMLSDNLYHEFIDDIVDMGLIAQDRIKSTKEIFIGETGEKNGDTEEKSIFARFKLKFRELVQR